MIYSFKNDYSEGAHPNIMKALADTNTLQTVGYSMDEYCEKARELIRKKASEKADVHFVVGGTQANLIVITTALRPYQAVISADSGHINTHETGAIEAGGHKVVAMPGENGKLTVGNIEKAVAEHTDEHMVQPKMVYISQPTEIGTLYSKEELIKIHECCKKHGLMLYIDGARLASALTSDINDVSLCDLAEYADAFTIGGTKCGAMFGEAVVIMSDRIKEAFRYMIKQRGAMLAKGRLLGIQFYELFKDDLYYEAGMQSNKTAMIIKNAFLNCGFKLLTDSHTNQQFPIIDNKTMKVLEKDYLFETWCATDDEHTAVRFVTSWATPTSAAENFADRLKEITKGE